MGTAGLSVVGKLDLCRLFTSIHSTLVQQFTVLDGQFDGLLSPFSAFDLKLLAQAWNNSDSIKLYNS